MSALADSIAVEITQWIRGHPTPMSPATLGYQVAMLTEHILIWCGKKKRTDHSAGPPHRLGLARSSPDPRANVRTGIGSVK